MSEGKSQPLPPNSTVLEQNENGDKDTQSQQNPDRCEDGDSCHSKCIVKKNHQIVT